MSFLSGLDNFTKNLGRGALDYYTLGIPELARKFGGEQGKNILNNVDRGVGSAWEAMPVALGGMYGMGALGAGGAGGAGGASAGGAGAGAAGMSAPNMAAAGSTLGAGGASSPLSLGGYGSAGGMGGPPTVAGATPVSKALQMMRQMPQGGQQQPQAPQGDPRMGMLQKIYQMYPRLQPHLGGQNGPR